MIRTISAEIDFMSPKLEDKNKPNSPVVTVLMSVYNGEVHLHQAIDSILAQTRPDFEFLIIDDGSNDDSLSIIKSYKDQRIRLIQNANNIGLAKCLNIGIELARGKYIARMDCDDISLSNRLEVQVEYMDKHENVAVSGSYVEMVGKNTGIVKYPTDCDEIRCYLLAGPPFAHPSVIMRKSVLTRYNIFYDESFSRSQDYELWIRLLQVASAGNIERVLFQYRIHDHQVSSLYIIEQDSFAKLARKRLLKLFGIDATDIELDKHAEFFRGTLSPNMYNLNWANEWLNRIVLINTKNKFFKHNTLKRFLQYYWWIFCDKCSYVGINTIEISKKSLLRDSLFCRILMKLQAL